MGRLVDLAGKKYGRLTVLEREGTNSHKQVMWRCKCDCGSIVIVTGIHLKSGDTKSCGCLHNLGNNKKHGMRKTRIYNTWAHMCQRCINVNDNAYKDYGGRGITVCAEWLNSFEAFRDWALANGYRDDLTIDRIDPNGNYEPSNCRWATQKVQQNNRRDNVYVTIGEETLTLKQWSEKMQINYKTLHTRISRGWSVEKAIVTPTKKGDSK